MRSTCKVCSHPDLNVIEAELAGGKSLPLLARSWNLDESTLRRHKREHIRALALKAQMDPVSLVQDLIDLKNDLELRMGLGASRQVPRVGEDEARSMLPSVKEYAVLAPTYLRTIESIAKLTGAAMRPDPRDLIPLWGRMQAKLVEWAQAQTPAVRDELYKALEEIEAEAS
jgi:hypothetical protein